MNTAGPVIDLFSRIFRLFVFVFYFSEESLHLYLPLFEFFISTIAFQF